MGKTLKLSLFVLVASCALASAANVRALDTFGPRDTEAPSMLAYGFRGLGTGALVGLSAGYLVARDGNWDSSDWRPVGLGVGIGALVGTGVGLGLGAIDLGSDRPGVGAIVLRDTLYGTTLGGLAGALGGGISAIAQGEGNHVPLGAAIGGLSGAGIGLIVGFIEGPRIVNSAAHRAARIMPSFAANQDASHNTVWTVGANGRF